MTDTNHTLIDATNVGAVLLSDGWHDVNPGSFAVARFTSGEEVGARGYRFEETDHGSPLLQHSFVLVEQRQCDGTWIGVPTVERSAPDPRPGRCPLS
jgi:hypothetical protein